MAVLKVKNGTDWVPVDSGTDSGIKGDMFAWANFDGDNGDLNGSHGVSSVLKLGGNGNYDVKLASPQPDMNYGTHVTPGNKPDGKPSSICAVARYSNGRSDESSVNVFTSYYNNVAVNVNPIFVTLFRYTGS